MVLCCLFLVSEFGDVSPYVCSYYFSLVSVAEWPTVSVAEWEIAAHSVDHMFSFVF